MTVTILAFLFLLIVLAVTFVGFKAVIRQGRSPEEIDREKCSLCRTPYQRTSLVERQVGDHHLFYFCHSCIDALYRDHLTAARTETNPRTDSVP